MVEAIIVEECEKIRVAVGTSEKDIDQTKKGKWRIRT